MGGTTSKSVVDKLTQVTNTIVSNAVTNCSSATSVDQTIDLNNVRSIKGSTFSNSSKVKLNISCAASSSMIAKLTNDISSAIAQEALSSGTIADLFSPVQSEAVTQIKNILSTTMTSNAITNSFNAVAVNQKIKLSNIGSVEDSTMSNVDEVEEFVKIVTKAVQDSNIFNIVSDKVNNSSSSKGGILGDIGTNWVILIGIIAAIIAVALLVMVRMFSSS